MTFRMPPPARPAMIRTAILALLLAGCGSHQQAAHQGLVRLSDDEVKGLDPQKISDLTSLRVAEDQFEGLTRHRVDGRVELDLASKVECNAAGLACRASLKPGLHFSDGTPITALTFAARSGWIADVPAPENFLAVHLSGAGAVYYSGFANLAYDRLVAQALDTAAPAQRTRLLQAAEERMLKAAPILPILLLCQPVPGGARPRGMAG
ncbi:MAG: hypothetical protein ABIO86_12235 [Sphingomonas sp.]